MTDLAILYYYSSYILQSFQTDSPVVTTFLDIKTDTVLSDVLIEKLMKMGIPLFLRRKKCLCTTSLTLEEGRVWDLHPQNLPECSYLGVSRVCGGGGARDIPFTPSLSHEYLSGRYPGKEGTSPFPRSALSWRAEIAPRIPYSQGDPSFSPSREGHSIPIEGSRERTPPPDTHTEESGEDSRREQKVQYDWSQSPSLAATVITFAELHSMRDPPAQKRTPQFDGEALHSLPHLQY